MCVRGLIYRLSRDCHLDIDRDVSTMAYCRSSSGDSVAIVLLSKLNHLMKTCNTPSKCDDQYVHDSRETKGKENTSRKRVSLFLTITLLSSTLLLNSSPLSTPLECDRNNDYCNRLSHGQKRSSL